MKQTIGMLVVAILISTAIVASPSLVNNSISSALNNIENPGKNELVIVPSFKTGAAKISFKSVKAAKGSIVVLDEQGNTVLKQDAAIEAGKNTLIINNFTSLNEGAYKVCVKAGKKTYTSSYLLWK